MPLYLKDKLVSGTGAQGSPGKSAYEAAKEGGYIGTEAEFNEALAVWADAIPSSEKGAANGVATLGEDALLAVAQRPKAGGLYRDDGTTTVEESLTEISTTLQKKVNTNLLDNWYFSNAVNQRGATGSITINRYFIDRWLYANGDSASSLTFNDGVVTLNGNNGYCALRQILETPKSVFIGRSMTISVLTTNMGLVSYTFTCLDGVENFKNFSDTGSYIVFDTRADNVLFTFVANMETLSVIACKVEFGDQQTLAHQENGVWVLNEIPDYTTEYLKCKRYYRRCGIGLYMTTQATNAFVITFPFDVPMRTAPVANFIRTNFKLYSAMAANSSITVTDPNIIINQLYEKGVRAIVFQATLSAAFEDKMLYRFNSDYDIIELSADL